MIRQLLKATLTFTALLAGAATLVSCQSSGEKEDLASAQSCLDAVPQSDPGQAEQCLSMVDGYSSPKAAALKCSIYMTSGGLIESKIVKAYNALDKSSGNNKEATFMALLSLDLPTLDIAYDKAIKGHEFCKASGSKGLVFVGSAIVAGTYINKMIKDTTGTAIDPANPEAAATAVKTMLDSCSGPSPAAACSADPATLGNVTLTLANAYCSGSSADQDVCGKVNSAVSTAGGDPAKVGQALYCYLNKKTYNSVSDSCNP